MSLATDLFTAVGNGASACWDAVRPYKEAVFGLLTIAGGGAAAFFGGYKRQARRPEEALDAAAAFASRPPAPRMHPDDHAVVTALRSCIGDLRESVDDLTRETRRNSKAVDENTEALNRNRGGGGGVSRHR